MKTLLSLAAAFLMMLVLALPATIEALPRTKTPEPASFGNITAGEAAFQIICAGCHGANAQGSLGPDIVGKTPAQIRFALANVITMGGLTVTPAEIDAIAGFLQSLTPPQVTIRTPAAGRMTSGVPNVITANFTSAGSNVTSAQFQALFARPGEIALQISPQFSTAVPAPLKTGNVTADTFAVPAGLPAGSVMLAVITGNVTAVDNVTGEWQIGTPPLFVYSSNTTSNPVAGSFVTIQALRTLAPGPLVAISTGVSPGTPRPVAFRETQFLFNGAVGSIQPTVESNGVKISGTWTVAGAAFRTGDDPPAAISPGLTQGSRVTVRYRHATPPGTAASNIAVDISPKTSTVVQSTLHLAPVANTDESPLTIPAASVRKFTIEGIVAAVSPNGEWQIGNPPLFVYQSPGTSVSPQAAVGAKVLIAAKRTVAPGPLVADNISFLGFVASTGALVAPPATVKETFLFNGAASSANASSWTVRGNSFVVNDPETPAVIGTGLGTSSNVTVEFRVVGPPPPAPGPWAPLAATSSNNTWAASVVAPVTNAELTGFLFVRAVDASQRTGTAMSAAVLAVPPPVPVTGGGGGGATPTSSVPVALRGLDGSLTVDGSGASTSTALLKNGPGTVSINVPSGTVLRASNGSNLDTITVQTPPAVPPPPPGRAIAAAQDFGPDGATFTPGITLTLSYPASLPSGMDEAGLVLSWWNGAQWANVPSTLDKSARTVTATISHFTTYAITGAISAPAGPTVPPTTVPQPTALPQTPSATTAPPQTTIFPIVVPPTFTVSPGPQTTHGSVWLMVTLLAGAAAVTTIVIMGLRRRGKGQKS